MSVKMMVLAGCLAGLTLWGCGNHSERPATLEVDPDRVEGTGTIMFLDLEGGKYVIQTDDGQTFDPLDLADEFKKDELKVRYTLEVQDDTAGAQMVGPPVKVLAMEKL